MFFWCCNPHRFLQLEVLRLYFLTLEPWVVHSVLLPSCSSWFICMQMRDNPFHQQPPCLPQSASHYIATCPLFPGLPISAPPTSLNECFFFNSLVVGLPYSSIFWLFWLLFVFKFVVLLLVVQGGKVYLPTPPSWLEVLVCEYFKSTKCVH